MYLLEPEEEFKSESWEDEKFDESKYRKKVDALSLRIACWQASSEVGKKFGERASGSQSVVTPRAKRVGRGGACRQY